MCSSSPVATTLCLFVQGSRGPGICEIFHTKKCSELHLIWGFSEAGGPINIQQLVNIFGLDKGESYDGLYVSYRFDKNEI